MRPSPPAGRAEARHPGDRRLTRRSDRAVTASASAGRDVRASEAGVVRRTPLGCPSVFVALKTLWVCQRASPLASPWKMLSSAPLPKQVPRRPLPAPGVFPVRPPPRGAPRGGERCLRLRRGRHSACILPTSSPRVRTTPNGVPCPCRRTASVRRAAPGRARSRSGWLRLTTAPRGCRLASPSPSSHTRRGRSRWGLLGERRCPLLDCGRPRADRAPCAPQQPRLLRCVPRGVGRGHQRARVVGIPVGSVRHPGKDGRP